MYNPKDYKKKEWQEYRLRIWEADNHQCVRCGKYIENPRKAQIHHRIYLPNLMPWEYDETDCVCLCPRCHLEEHGLEMPSSDWVYIGCTTFDAYGDTTCDLCGNELKYEHEIWHPKWGSLFVGVGCCEKLTSSLEKQEMLRVQNYHRRISNRDRWAHLEEKELESWNRKFDGYNLEIRIEENSYRIYIESHRGAYTYSSFEEAVEHLSSLLFYGKIDEIFTSHGIAIPEKRLNKIKAYKRKSAKETIEFHEI